MVIQKKNRKRVSFDRRSILHYYKVIILFVHSAYSLKPRRIRSPLLIKGRTGLAVWDICFVLNKQ